MQARRVQGEGCHQSGGVDKKWNENDSNEHPETEALDYIPHSPLPIPHPTSSRAHWLAARIEFHKTRE